MGHAVVVFVARELGTGIRGGNEVVQGCQDAVLGVGLELPALIVEDVRRSVAGEVGLDFLVVAAGILLHGDVEVVVGRHEGIDHVVVDHGILHIGPGGQAQVHHLTGGHGVVAGRGRGAGGGTGRGQTEAASHRGHAQEAAPA